MERSLIRIETNTYIEYEIQTKIEHEIGKLSSNNLEGIYDIKRISVNIFSTFNSKIAYTKCKPHYNLYENCAVN